MNLECSLSNIDFYPQKYQLILDSSLCRLYASLFETVMSQKHVKFAMHPVLTSWHESS
ncbi:hypothetical protein SAMN04488028_1011021 [Reichenbachiella agariperforans]|uniref:Uncharacterized protein n=1 Tax=Reichenbachiella agariperforans TaxID=156994 RepID=A0A1M6LMA4_REIAG|nr:hypothetical protein SAMN04488028_1011021 [Reichenbachiella agariperforans]